MADKDLTGLSRYIAFLLRHDPGSAGLRLDEHGWAEVEELIACVRRTRPIDRETLERIVREDSKQRFCFSPGGGRIRASQGHSISVDVELEELTPPEILWHGTAEKYVQSILRSGLEPRTRLYVHLSGEEETALTVGRRHGKPVVFPVMAGQMHRAGYRFYRSANGVWLTKKVPAEYLNTPE